jgi:hypothetical protein
LEKEKFNLHNDVVDGNVDKLNEESNEAHQAESDSGGHSDSGILQRKEVQISFSAMHHNGTFVTNLFCQAWCTF